MIALAQLGTTCAYIMLMLTDTLNTSTCKYCINTRYAVIGEYMYKPKKEIRHRGAQDILNYQIVYIAYMTMLRPAFDYG